MCLPRLIAFTRRCGRLTNRRRWHTSNHIISKRILFILWCRKGVEETATQVLASLATPIELRNIILRGLGQVVSAHVLHIRLVHNVSLERLLSCAFCAIVAYEHDLHILLVWMRITLSRRVGVCVTTDFDLLDTGMATNLG